MQQPRFSYIHKTFIMWLLTIIWLLKQEVFIKCTFCVSLVFCLFLYRGANFMKLVIYKLDPCIYVPVKLKLQHPHRATPRAFELLKIGLFKFLPSGLKGCSKAPPISTEIPLFKDKFVFNQTLFTLLRVRYAVMTPSNVF